MKNKFYLCTWKILNKGNNKITEHRTPNNLPKGKSKLINQQTDKINQQPENWENCNGPDLVQAFIKKGIVGIPLTGLTFPHLYACLKPGPGFLNIISQGLFYVQ